MSRMKLRLRRRVKQAGKRRADCIVHKIGSEKYRSCVDLVKEMLEKL